MENDPFEYAAAIRSFILLRIGIHSGLRPRNLRELLFTLPKNGHRPEIELARLKRGEIRWNAIRSEWEIFVPYTAFKNHYSSFFKRQHYKVRIPDSDDFYKYLNIYLIKCRPILLNGMTDPQTIFVRSMKSKRGTAEFLSASFHQVWRETIARYGVYNPYTKRGVIKGLLPHGPHSVRDVIVTHILKKTGCFTQASYAIQDTPETVEKYYGRFIPTDKTALASLILDKEWI